MGVVEYLAVDTETTGLDLHHGCKPFMLTYCDAEGNTGAIEWPVDAPTRTPIPSQKHLEEISARLSGKHLVFHHAKFDLRALATIGVGVCFPSGFRTLPEPETRCEIVCAGLEDTNLASHPIASNKSRKLKDLGVLYLDMPRDDETDLKKAIVLCGNRARKQRPEWNLGTDPKGDRKTGYDYWLPRALQREGILKGDEAKWGDLCTEYGIKDAERTMLLWLLYKSVLDDDEAAERAYRREMDLVPVVYNMEGTGVHIRQSAIDEGFNRLKTTYDEQYEKAGRIGKVKCNLDEPINPQSDRQVRRVLFSQEGWGLTPSIFTTKSKEPSTNKQHLEDLYFQEPPKTCKRFIIELLKLKSVTALYKYLQGYEKYKLPSRYDGYYKLYPTFNQVGTSTTRWSSSNPNGQNISKKEKVEIADQEIDVFNLRSVFGPPPGRVWYRIDYSQLELRIFAAVSNEESLIESFRQGYDFHGYVASRIFNKPPEEISSQERTIAKNVNFALIYGAGEGKVDATAGMEGAYELFSGQFPNARRFMDLLLREAKIKYQIQTHWGYPLAVPRDRPYACLNYKIQGTAGDIIKNAMVKIHESGLVDWNKRSILLQIHDELILESESDLPDNDAWALEVCNTMVASGQEIGIETPVECKRVSTTWNKGEVLCQSSAA